MVHKTKRGVLNMNPILYTRAEIKAHIQAIRQAQRDITRGISNAGVSLTHRQAARVYVCATEALPLMLDRLSLELAFGARHRAHPYPRGW